MQATKTGYRRHTPRADGDRLAETGVCTAPGEDAVRPLYRAALDREHLTITDALMIRDLLEVSGLREPVEPGLHRVLLALCAARNQGSLCLRLDEEAFRRSLRRCCGEAPAAAVWRDILEKLDSGAWEALVSRNGDRYAPVVYVPTGPYLYFQRYYVHERRLKERLFALAGRREGGTTLPPEKAAALTLEAARYEHFAGTGGLAPEQVRGVYLTLRNAFTIISGGPGTGKTTLVTSILRALVRGGVAAERIFLVAPTGRAGRRIGEAVAASLELAGAALDPETRTALTGIEGSTIHRLLRYNPTYDDYTYGPDNPLPADMLICDEVSMVDVVLMDRLLAALPPAAGVIFLGDRDQLPSVEAGAVLGDLIPRTASPLYTATMRAELEAIDPTAKDLPVTSRPTPLTDRIVLLRRSHRARGAVPRLAAAFNRGGAEAITGMRVLSPRPVAFTGGGSEPGRAVFGIEWGRFESDCIRIEPGPDPVSTLRQVLLSWTDWLFRGNGDRPGLVGLLDGAGLSEAELAAGELPEEAAPGAMLDCLARGQILTVTRRGPCGCERINRFLAEFWRDRLDPARPAHEERFGGAPIMVIRNEYRRGLFNGDAGILIRAADSGRLYGVFRRGGGLVAFPVETLPEYEFSFAMTVHKSQGSEYGNVLLAAPADPGHPLLTREIVYTGITRTRGNAFLFAAEDVLQAAANRRIERYSGMNLWGPDAG